MISSENKKLNDFNKFNNTYKLLYGDDFCNIIQDKKTNVCRFCLRDTRFTSFKNKSHAISHCLGNKTIILLNECDKCNSYFGDIFENDLASYTLPIRNLNSIKGKNKKPKYKSNDKKATIESVKDKDKFLEIIAQTGSSIIEQEDTGFKLEFDIEPYTPLNVYKALVKMALSIMPEEYLEKFMLTKMQILNEHSEYKTFLEEKNPELLRILNESKKFPIFGTLISTHLMAMSPFDKTHVYLYLNEENKKHPNCIFIIAFGNVIYQIAIASDLEYTTLNPKLEPLLFLPSYINTKYSNIEYKIKIDDLSSIERVKGEKYVQSFRAQKQRIPVELANKYYKKEISIDKLLSLISIENLKDI